jgi:hypothetical protein
MTVKELIQKYPRIFPPLEDGKVNKKYIMVPEGWVRVLDHFFSCIQQHVDTYQHYDHEGRKHTCPQVVATDLGELFGVIKFSYEGGDAHVAGMLRMAQTVCENICCVCSSPNDLGLVIENLIMCCKDCYDNDRVPGSNWKSVQAIDNLINNEPDTITDGTQQS